MVNYFLRSRARKKPKTEEEPPPSLPDDVLFEILKRLPLESLVRFTCICKSWLSLITSPSFNSTFSNFNLKYSNSNDTQKPLLFRQSINIHKITSRMNFSVYDPDTCVREAEFEFPIGRNHFVVCSSYGLVCLFDFYSNNPITTPLILWNPSIRKAVNVCVPGGGALEFTPGGFPKLIFGFGFDSVSTEYKVVRVAYFKGSQGGLNGTSFRTDVYCVGDGEWRDLGMGVLPHIITTIRWRGECVNGVIHWVCNVMVNGEVRRLVLSLKLRYGEFGEIQLPKELVDKPNLRVVTVPRANNEVLGVVHIVTNDLSLWVMEKYAGKESWVKLFSVTFEEMIRNEMSVSVLSDHVVVVQNVVNSWVYYDHEKQEMRPRRLLRPFLDYVDTYLESLILVGSQNGIIHVKNTEEVQQKKRKPRKSSRVGFVR